MFQRQQQKQNFGFPHQISFAGKKSNNKKRKLAKSDDGETVVNIEAIADAGKVDEFFSDPAFVEKFRALDAVSTSEFHTYRVGDLILPGAVFAAG